MTFALPLRLQHIHVQLYVHTLIYPCADPLLPFLQLRGHGSYSELAEVEGSRRFLKVLLAEDNLINMKVDTSLCLLLLLQHLSTTRCAMAVV